MDRIIPDTIVTLKHHDGTPISQLLSRASKPYIHVYRDENKLNSDGTFYGANSWIATKYKHTRQEDVRSIEWMVSFRLLSL